MSSEPMAGAAPTVKQCCARLYESDFVRFLLGDSFHPGGLALTERLGELLRLTPSSRVLDAACGQGTSAVFLAERFGCHVTGIDYGERNIVQANELATAKGLASRARCERADAEQLPFPCGSYDAVICECAFCTFPDKSAAVAEFARVLRPGGRVGLSDVTRAPGLPQELDGLLARIACIAEAQPVEGYQAYLRGAGLEVNVVETHDAALTEMVEQVQTRLLGAEILIGIGKLDLPGVDFPAARRMARAAQEAIRDRQIGYALVCGLKP